MHDEPIPRELQDRHPLPGDGWVPFGWLRSIDRACTAWLLKRDLLDPSVERPASLSAPANEEELP